MIMKRMAAAMLLAAPLPCFAAAQEMSQVSDPQPEPIAQISAGAPRADDQQLGTREEHDRPLSQLNNERGVATAAPQLAREGDRRTTPQLYRGGRTAQPLEALSRPAEGRTGAVTAVQGDDRCDPADARSRRSQACQRVIETRSAEFARPEPAPLSPEQRLLSEQRNRDMRGDGAAARRLANNTGNPDELQDQAIASVALANSLPARAQQEEEPSRLSSETQALVQALVNQLTNPQ